MSLFTPEKSTMQKLSLIYYYNLTLVRLRKEYTPQSQNGCSGDWTVSEWVQWWLNCTGNMHPTHAATLLSCPAEVTTMASSFTASSPISWYRGEIPQAQVGRICLSVFYFPFVVVFDICFIRIYSMFSIFVYVCYTISLKIISSSANFWK